MKPAMKEMVWGGTWIHDRFGKDIPSSHTGESWEVAAHPHGQARADGGPDDGKTLQEMIFQYGASLVGTDIYERYGDFFPLLIKFIDSNSNLSVQVHPNDDAACELEGPDASGKTEMWYVLDAKEGARLVYGLTENLSDEQFLGALADGTFEKYLNWIPVQPGDAFFIPSGTLHAIGSGLLIAEIQQNSNLTYRVYDYGRLGLDGKPRELHVDKALEVVNRIPPEPGTLYMDIDQGIRSPYFETYRVRVQGADDYDIDPKRFEIWICVGGEGQINGKSMRDGDTFLVPASAGHISLAGRMTCLRTFVP